VSCPAECAARCLHRESNLKEWHRVGAIFATSFVQRSTVSFDEFNLRCNRISPCRAFIHVHHSDPVSAIAACDGSLGSVRRRASAAEAMHADSSRQCVGISRTSRGKICPYAMTTITSAKARRYLRWLVDL
jgi:hypothetical protein